MVNKTFLKSSNFSKVKTSLLSFLFVALIFQFFSCQREIHFDFISEGFLEKDLNNNCQVTINGDYAAGKSFDGSNYLKLPVHIVVRGSYSITTDTVNGYSFHATGDFKDTGVVLVTLKGYGKPLANGRDQFTVVYGTSNCEFTNKVNGGQ